MKASDEEVGWEKIRRERQRKQLPDYQSLIVSDETLHEYFMAGCAHKESRLLARIERLREAINEAIQAFRGGTVRGGVFWRENADDKLIAALSADEEEGKK